MTEVILLYACHARASQLRFKTTGESLRIAVVIDGSYYEIPQPPDCVRSPMIDQLRRIFSMSTEQTHAECELHIETATACAQLEFKKGGAVLTILRNFENRNTVARVLNRFWRDKAASQGFLVLSWYYVMEAISFLYNAANMAIRPSRRSAVI